MCCKNILYYKFALTVYVVRYNSMLSSMSLEIIGLTFVLCSEWLYTCQCKIVKLDEVE